MTEKMLKNYAVQKAEILQLKKLLKSTQGYTAPGGTGDEIAQLCAEMYAEKLKRLKRELASIEAAIDGLDDPVERIIIRERYLVGSSWTRVARLINYSRTATFEKHRSALNKLQA